MYFSKFPKILYTLDDQRSGQVVPDIMRRAIINEEYKNNSSYYDLYDVKDGETPEMLADLFYGNPQYHWIILHANDIIDPRFDWPLSQENLYQFCVSKYGGEEKLNKTKLYTNNVSYVVNSRFGLDEASPDDFGDETPLVFEMGSNFLLEDAPPGLTAVSNYEYELAVNERKRRIKVPKPQIVANIINTFSDLINK